jgi:hypothetical protein
MEALMKKVCIAVFLGIGLLIIQGCSSSPPGTVSIADILEKESELLDQPVVVIGRAETQTTMSKFNMFKLYKGGDSVWVEFPASATMPPQAEKVRVDGTLKRKKFSGMPEAELYVEAASVDLE